jgi:hypothetical protein
MLPGDLFDSPNGAPSCRSSAANGHGHGHEVIAPLLDALVHENSMTEGDKNEPIESPLPYPFLGFGLQDSDDHSRGRLPRRRKSV